MEKLVLSTLNKKSEMIRQYKNKTMIHVNHSKNEDASHVPYLVTIYCFVSLNLSRNLVVFNIYVLYITM